MWMALAFGSLDCVLVLSATPLCSPPPTHTHLKLASHRSRKACLLSYCHYHGCSPATIAHNFIITMGALQWLALGIPVVVFAVAYLLPGCILRAASRLFPRVIFFFRLPQPASKLIALTIDDSPDEVLTPAALAVLQQHGARASFFCIGAHVKEAESGAAILKQMVQQGCELGNHTWLDRPSWKLPAAVLESELRDVEALFSEAYREAGVARPAQKWFRPGQGFFTGAMLDLAEAQGYLTALGDCFPYDPQAGVAVVVGRWGGGSGSHLDVHAWTCMEVAGAWCEWGRCRVRGETFHGCTPRSGGTSARACAACNCMQWLPIRPAIDK